MNRRTTRSLLAVGMTLALAGTARADRPNILWILADDLGYSDLGCYGGRKIGTPAIDRLAALGTRFTDYYTPTAVCLPTRISLYTGRYALHTGVRDNGDRLVNDPVTVAEALRDLGYETALIGKWHKTRDCWMHPLDQGFAHSFGFLDAGEAHEYYPKSFWRDREKVADDRYATDAFTGEAVAFLKTKRDRPFFLHVPYTAPHMKIQAPAEAVAAYRGKFEEPPDGKPIHATYAAMVTRMDDGVGKILAALKEAGLEENTLVIFTSDHGATFESGALGCPAWFDSNFPFRGQKRTVYEGGIRVPFIVRWPGKAPEGKVSGAILHGIDLLPTLVTLAGGKVDPAWGVDGVDVSAVWRGTAAAPERDLFWDWRATDSWAVRRGNWKLVRERGVSGLYDLPTDPAERRDLGGVHPDVQKDLETALDAWIRTGPAAEKPPQAKGRGRKQ